MWQTRIDAIYLAWCPKTCYCHSTYHKSDERFERSHRKCLSNADHRSPWHHKRLSLPGKVVTRYQPALSCVCPHKDSASTPADRPRLHHCYIPDPPSPRFALILASHYINHRLPHYRHYPYIFPMQEEQQPPCTRQYINLRPSLVLYRSVLPAATTLYASYHLPCLRSSKEIWPSQQEDPNQRPVYTAATRLEILKSFLVEALDLL